MEQDKNEDIPQDVIDTLAHIMLPEILIFFESEEGKQAFDRWKSEQQKKVRS